MTTATGADLLTAHDRLTIWRGEPSPDDAARLRASLAEADRAVLLVDAAAARSLGDVLALGPVGDLPIIGAPSADDPLVVDTRLRAVAADGSTLAGEAWADLAAIAELWEGANVVARVGDRPAALAGPAPGSPGAHLTVVGCAELASDRWLPTADTATFLTWALTGQVDQRIADEVKLSPAGDPALPHPDVLVVAAGTAPELVAAAPAPGEPLDSESFLAAVRHSARLLPAAVHDALVDFADHSSAGGALLLRGMPVGDVPPTPLVPGRVEGKDRVSEFVLLTVARRLGHPIGYLPEHGGRIVQDLSPTPEAVTRQTSTSSGVELAFHTETAFHPHRPRYLLLLCLRGDPAARTTLCSVHAAMQHLTRGQIAVLREARFRTGVDESFVGGRSDVLGHLLPVLAGTDDAPTLTFDADLMVGDDAEAEAALDALSVAVGTAKIGVTLATGDLLVVDNQVAVHGRSPFTARFDGTDRWLQRTFVVPDLTASAADRTGRIITTRFVR